MEALLSLLLLFVLVTLIATDSKTFHGVLKAWLLMFFFAAVSRLSLALIPRWTPLLLQTLLFIVSTFALFQMTRRWKRVFKTEYLPFGLALAFVWMRNYFPQFDVDSMSYHLQAMRWLYERPLLPPVHQFIENSYMAYRLIGFEEFLLGFGLNLDLAFFGGLLGGVLKCLSVLTVISLIPARLYFFRYFALYLLLIDDHFFFSGQSRFVYLNPSLIGLLTLTLFSTWKSLRGDVGSLWLAAGLAMGLAGNKYHGLYFLVFVSVILAVFLFGFWRRGQFGKLRLPKTWEAATLVLGFAVFFSLYGMNLVETGTPTYPMSLGPFHPHYLSTGLEAASRVAPQGSFLVAFMKPIRTIVFPGNLAMKFAAVLLFPTLFAWLGLAFWPKRASFFVRRRWLTLAAICFMGCWLWTSIAQYMVEGESRYPRYVFGLAILGISALGMSFRARAFLPRRVFQFFQLIRPPSSLVAVSAGLAVLLVLVVRVDTRYYNIPRSERPTWKQILSATTSSLRPRALDENVDFYSALLQPLPVKNHAQMFGCLQAQAEKFPDLKRGYGLAVFGPMNWPSYLLAPFAIRADPLASVRLPQGHRHFEDAGVCHVIIPREWNHGHIPELQNLNPVSVDLLKSVYQGEELCESEEMKLVRLPKCRS